MFPLTPALSLKGEGVLRAGIILWGTLSPVGEDWGEGIRPHRPGKKAQNACSTSRHFFICI
ncbi:hypothetical protein SD66_10330 [Enterobacter cloacae]|nr:hypothetical protein SD66_10330 [Enterobacter cloacae]PDP90157.1 hypothetical protein CGQ17_21370 [Enterobacter cloacae]